ncbi:MAG: aldehyde dehydrogenase family protein [Candidatus Paceibacterota bacterium]
MDLRVEISQIFEESMLFSFICGSYLQIGSSIRRSDIDIFCCVDSFSREQDKKFRELYFSFHQKMGAKPDIYFPGELVTFKELESGLRLVIKQKPQINIKSKRVYDGLVWAGMIVDNKKMISGEIPRGILSSASNCIRRWNKELFGDNSVSTKRLAEQVIYDDDFLLKSGVILKRIRENKKLITDILLEVESYETVEDELYRSMDCLENIKKEKDFLTSAKVKYISSFLPVNLPLYSLVIFGFIPSLMSKKVFVRATKSIAPVVKVLKSILFGHYGGIYVSQDERDDFVRDYVKHSEVILFTGRYQNVQKLERKFPNKLIIYNGAGINPIIVNMNANIALACDKTLKTRVFNSGQDCAGPDTILIHSEVFSRFVDCLNQKIKKIKVGGYADRKVRVGRLLKPIHLDTLERDMREGGVVSGGNIDRENGIVYPTIICKPLSQYKNYREFFAPIFWISEFKNEEELKSYFNTKNYTDFAMYVSVFGDLPRFQIPKSTVLRNEVVLDVERGNLEYGGYGDKANFVSYMGSRKIKPILISREISQWKVSDNL